jgi:ATP-binding cassette, subfamily B, bacterial
VTRVDGRRGDLLRRLAPYVAPARAKLGTFVVLLAVEAAGGVASPLILRAVVDDGILARRPDVVTELALLAAATAVVTTGVMVVQRWLVASVAEQVTLRLRTEIFDRLLAMPVAFYERSATGAVVNRVVTDVAGAQSAVTSILSVVLANAVGLASTAAAIAALSWQMSLVALATLPLFFFPARLTGERLRTLTTTTLGDTAALSSSLTDRLALPGARLVRLYGSPSRESAEFRRRAAGLAGIGVRVAVLGQGLFLTIMCFTALVTAVVYGWGGQLVISGAVPLGTLVALVALLARLYGPLHALANVHVDVVTARSSLERVFELLDFPQPLPQAPHPAWLPREAPLTVEFTDVGLRHLPTDLVTPLSLRQERSGEDAGRSGPPVLREISLTLPAGGRTALVGPTGAGKSTLASLIARMYDVSSGSVTVGGHDVRTLHADSLRAAVGVVPQEPHLFHDTVRANLLLGNPDADDDELVAACRAAHVWHVVDALPEGLETVVGDHGQRFSGGERQRLALARLLVKRPRVAVLDESTAHLDPATEAAVQDVLATALEGCTVLVIAHRLSAVRDADVIHVLDDGRLVQSGRHDELVAAEAGPYARIFRSQERHSLDSHSST